MSSLHQAVTLESARLYSVDRPDSTTCARFTDSISYRADWVRGGKCPMLALRERVALSIPSAVSATSAMRDLSRLSGKLMMLPLPQIVYGNRTKHGRYGDTSYFDNCNRQDGVESYCRSERPSLGLMPQTL